MQTQNINLTVPIKICYPVLQQVLETKLIGMEVGTEERKRGKILSVGLAPSPLADYHVVFELQLELARKLLWAKQIPMLIHCSLDFDPESGKLSVGTFKIDSKSRNFVLNRAFEFLANRVYYRKILDKASINLDELIAAKVSILNEKLLSGIAASKGMLFNGTMNTIALTKIEPGPEHFVVYARFKGEVEVTLSSLPEMDFTS
ncbi:hypothetical protein LCGC14_0993250 [marine sediment metagenome]|uniref:DUF4403 family protein n=2 Tax=root TaxID=1 RepID=A0A831QM92_9FLAO|nr:DUF4403 family protein [Pricia antarctica]